MAADDLIGNVGLILKQTVISTGIQRKLMGFCVNWDWKGQIVGIFMEDQ